MNGGKKEFHMTKIMEIIEKETRGKILGKLVLRRSSYM